LLFLEEGWTKEMQQHDKSLGRAFLDQAVTHLEEDFMPKIKSSIELLSEEDVWWRGSDIENSVGNLLLHLAGNVRQWIISGLGGAPDHRQRPREFSSRGGVSKSEVLSRLDATVSEATAVLRGLSADDLLTERAIQGFRQTGLQAVFHVVEHFGYHTGQIVYITKLRTQRDLMFYNL